MKTILRSILCTSLLCLSTAWANGANDPQVQFETTAGNFTVELSPIKAPKTVANFLQYVKDKHYDGTIFHRVIPGFVAQGGGMRPTMQEKPTRAPIELEAQNGLKNLTGSLAMARTGDPNSATSQFYINLRDNRSLDAPSPDGYGYAVFGKVVKGMEVIEKIARTPTGPGDVPRTPIIVQSARVVEETPSK